MAAKALYTDQELVTFRKLIPGIRSKLLRLPQVVSAVRSALKIKDDDYISLGWKLEENAQLYPDRPAILYENQCLTHAEFNQAVNRYSHYFLSRGIRKGDVVVVMLENRPAFLMVAGALAKIGAIAALINTNQRDRVLLHSVSLTCDKHFVIGEELVAAFEKIRPDLGLDGDASFYFVPDKGRDPTPENYIDLSTGVLGMSTDNPSTTGTIQAKDPICYIFTSGTTGLPKAAVMGNRRWVAAMYGLGRFLMNMKTDDVLYCPLPLFHTTGFCVGWTVAASMGSAFAIRRKFSVREFWQDARKFQATAFVYIGELCRYLLNQPFQPEDGDNPMKKCVGNGLRPDIWKKFKTRFSIRQISELYGATEFGFAFVNLFNIDNTVGLCLTPYAIVRYDIDEERPILDKNGRMQRVKKGEAGILIGEISDKVPFHGYTDPKASEEKIWRNVFKQGDVWLNTGDYVKDLGYRHIQFSDRLGDTFRWKGENVSTTEVEETINTLQDVEQAAAYGVRIPGTDGRAGMVSIIPAVPVESFDMDLLAEKLNQTLPAYAIPKFVRFKKELEITPTFKVKKAVLNREGFDPQTIADPMFALLPGEEKYRPLTQGLYHEIVEGKYRY